MARFDTADTGRLRRGPFGALYPRLSLENRELGWSSPFALSYSAINTWLGEEIRPLGAEWRLRRRLGHPASQHSLGLFAAAFYGDDPAGTLLFWRGWSLHDRQTRLGDRLALPPLPEWDDAGNIVSLHDQWLEPVSEIDHRPGHYLGMEWQRARRTFVQIAHYDNGADPNAFSAGQWGWRTRFTQVAFQTALPWRLGLITQWLTGHTEWLLGATPNGQTTPATRLVEDPFEAWFVLLTRLQGKHRVSLRRDGFRYTRDEPPPRFRSDMGRAWTLAYRFAATTQLEVGIEWLRIESSREPWAEFYGLQAEQEERLLTLRLIFHTSLSGP